MRPIYGFRVPLVAAAVCPHPPLIVPRLAAGAAPELDPLRTACADAVVALRTSGADRLVVVGTAHATGWLDPPYGGTFAPWGEPVEVGEPGRSLPLSLLVGRWLLDGPPDGMLAGMLAVAADTPPAACLALGADAVADGPVALLVMGDGSARHGERSPGYADPRADPFDRAVAAALAAGDPAGLAALDPALAAELWVAGRAAWQVLAGACGPAAAPWRAKLHYDGAAYGVGYLVASWT